MTVPVPLPNGLVVGDNDGKTYLVVGWPVPDGWRIREGGSRGPHTVEVERIGTSDDFLHAPAAPPTPREGTGKVWHCFTTWAVYGTCTGPGGGEGHERCGPDPVFRPGPVDSPVQPWALGDPPNARRFVALDDHEAEAALNAALPTGFYTPAAVIRSLNEADVVLVRDVPA
jgi:hypothetical protein